VFLPPPPPPPPRSNLRSDYRVKQPPPACRELGAMAGDSERWLSTASRAMGCGTEAAADAPEGARPPSPSITIADATARRRCRASPPRRALPPASAQVCRRSPPRRRRHSARLQEIVRPLACAALALAAITQSKLAVGLSAKRSRRLPHSAALHTRRPQHSQPPGAALHDKPLACVTRLLGQLSRPIRVGFAVRCRRSGVRRAAPAARLAWQRPLRRCCHLCRAQAACMGVGTWAGKPLRRRITRPAAAWALALPPAAAGTAELAG